MQYPDSTYMRAVSIFEANTVVNLPVDEFHLLLEEVDIDPAVLGNQNSFVTGRSYIQMMELLAERYDMPDYGMISAMALPSHFPNLGPLMHIRQFSRTVRDWLAACLRYGGFHTNMYHFEFLEVPETNEMKFRIHKNRFLPHDRQSLEGIMTIFSRIIRETLNIHHADPLKVNFMHAMPGSAEYHEQVFKCRLQFDAPHNEIIYSLDLMDEKLNGRFAKLTPLIDKFMGWIIQRDATKQVGMLGRTEAAIEVLLGSGRCNLLSVADLLGMHEKKLQRHLNDHGESFSSIFDRTRHRLAVQLLRDQLLPIGTIAGFLDYSSTKSFALAFKRWETISPQKYRQLHAESQQSPDL